MRLVRWLSLALLVVIPSVKAAKYLSNQGPDLNSLSDADLKGITVQFERTGCYGSCPAYTLTIHGDGRIEYVGNKYVKVKGTQQGRVEEVRIKELISEFAKAKFLSLPEDDWEKKCACRQCTDLPSAITELKVAGITHRVNHYYGCTCAPKSLFQLESSIDKAVQVDQWTGDVSQQGPFGMTCSG